jgi:hypothetical protein
MKTATVERLRTAAETKHNRLAATRERMGRRVAAATEAVKRVEQALQKAQERLKAAQAKVEQVRKDAATLIAKQGADAEAANKRLAEAEAKLAQPAKLKSSARAVAKTAKPSKDWTIAHDGGSVVVPPTLRGDLGLLLGNRRTLTLGNEFAGHLFDVLGIDQTGSVTLTIPGRKGYVGSVTAKGLELMRA